MCLILFAYNYHPDYRLILTANRDEFYARPTRPMQYWPEQSSLVAGKDLEQGGTWLGLTNQGRFSALTNHRDGRQPKQGDRTRGNLPLDFLLSEQSCETFINSLSPDRFDGFNQLIDDGEQLCYLSNRSHALQPVPAGIHGLSNAVFDTPWPKLEARKTALKDCIDSGELSSDKLIQLMANTDTFPDSRLPDTGITLDFERMLSASFIRSENYGTRATTALLIKHNGEAEIVEQNYELGGATERNSIRLQFKEVISQE
ncbi:NRDE family protein [Amphritea japonica]|uniref:NRDE family protein n=1 Tax=Amphritea japonica ATCC BAA-1530 TaxID=1278309 RepID=A0A7R6PGG3_9GAMM|nr:NRDE family protein [Amphritea japonica]BBB27806.1 conserved hypothetical protein [Amphritea japonica ATCC BAA-1530]